MVEKLLLEIHVCHNVRVCFCSSFGLLLCDLKLEMSVLFEAQLEEFSFIAWKITFVVVFVQEHALLIKLHQSQPN